MSQVKQAVQELEELATHSTIAFRRALERLIRAQVRSGQEDGALKHLRSVIGHTMTLADLTGRARLFLEMDAMTRGEGPPVLLFTETPVVPALGFREAISNLLTREPRLAGSAEEVGRLYREAHAFALARSSSIAITQRVRAAFEQFARRGVSLADAETVVAELGDWTRHYSETVYRTNLNTAYTAGRFQQAADPDVAAVVGGFELVTIGDSDVRRGRGRDQGENHLAADGLIAATTDVIWDRVAPPAGYNCRCSLRVVSRSELQQLGLIEPGGLVRRRVPTNFSEYRRHPNFATSRARRIYA